MRRLTLAVALFALPLAAAPVPKVKPRDGLILLLSGYGGGPVCLFRPDGEAVAEWQFPDASSAHVSPDGKRVAVVTRKLLRLQKNPPSWEYNVYLVPVTLADPAERGEPLITTTSGPALAWTPDGKGMYVSQFSPPPGGRGYQRAERVDLYDTITGRAEEQPKLAGCFVAAVSPDGKRLLASRYRQIPEGYDQLLLDRATFAPIDAGNDGLSLTHFVTDDTLLATRVKDDSLEHLFLNVATKKVTPVPVPKELSDPSVKIGAVLPSPDGRRLLYAWDEEVPAPPDWPGAASCRPARLTVADIDGKGATTIFRPVINTRADIVRAHWGTLDWR